MRMETMLRLSMESQSDGKEIGELTTEDSFLTPIQGVIDDRQAQRALKAAQRLLSY